jgi:alkaline phosphatase D
MTSVLGWFNAYGFAAHNTTPDAFIHLGDYVCTLLNKNKCLKQTPKATPSVDLRVSWKWVSVKQVLYYRIHADCRLSAHIGRAVLGRQLATIFDYRQRLAQYRTDQSLVFAHQSGPWITVWYVVLIRLQGAEQSSLAVEI